MNVLHIGTYDRRGGASIAAYRQHQALLRHGIDSRMWVRFKVTDDPTVTAFTPSKNLLARLPRLLRRQLIRRKQKKAGLLGEMFDAKSEHAASLPQAMPDADVINIQFAWGFLDYPSFFEMTPSNIPLVVTMHEMATYTGGCPYTAGCDRFHNNCGNCPKLRSRSPDDLSRDGWQQRQMAYRLRYGRKLHFVADSHWVAAEARKSSLLKDMPISVIHYGLDTSIYRPIDRVHAKLALGIPKDRKVVSFAAASWSDERKGMRYLVEALNGMPEKPFLLTWGKNFSADLQDVPRLHLGNIENEHFMALAYNASDVFVMPSLEEAFGQTALEAIASGTPVAAFAAGGIPETVRHEETGLLAKVGSSDELRHNISRLLNDQMLWAACSRRGVEVVNQEFGYKLNAESYIKLYETLLLSQSQHG